ncbi:unnamed protein product, partial [Owenia fusiformis]
MENVTQNMLTQNTTMMMLSVFITNVTTSIENGNVTLGLTDTPINISIEINRPKLKSSRVEVSRVEPPQIILIPESDDNLTSNDTGQRPETNTSNYKTYKTIGTTETQRKIWNYWSPLIIVFGTFGNALSLCVLGRKKMRSRTTSVYLIALACVDMGALWMGLVPHWLNYINTDIQPYGTSSGCKILTFLLYVCVHLSAWILVTVTIERIIAVFIPLKAKSLCEIKVSFISLLVLILGIICLNLNILWIYDIDDEKCTFTGQYQHFWSQQWVWVDGIIATYLPFTIMIISNFAIIGKLILRNKMGIGAKKKLTSMTLTLLLCNFTFIGCTLPIVLLMSFKDKWYPNRNNHLDP